MFFALILPLLVLAPAKPLDHSRLLRAIEAVEGGDPASRGGRACISEAVYRQHGSVFYRTTAFRHLRWIEEQVGPDVERIALAWRWGVGGAARHQGDDYGRRVLAIYLDE